MYWNQYPPRERLISLVIEGIKISLSPTKRDFVEDLMIAWQVSFSVFKKSN